MNGVSEAEKNRFNYDLEILQNNEIKAEDLLNTIDIIKDKIIDISVVSNQELKIEVSRNGSDQNVVDKLKEFIQKEKNKTYGLKVEYDNETGLVKYMILTILEKNKRQ